MVAWYAVAKSLPAQSAIARGQQPGLANARPDPRWRRREQFRSPRYTTRLDELPVAYC